MKHGSLFSGIGGFDLAAEWMGWENVFHCEWNQYCQKILKQHFPNSISYGDITKTDFTEWRGKIDIVSGGFPCQPYSTAGKRKGKEDDRHLWPEMLRAIREIQPGWVVGENVPGLLNWERGLVLAEIKADLEAEGFEVLPPCILPACGKNAPHRRDRLWIIAHAKSNIIGDVIRDEGQKSQPIQEERSNESIVTTNPASVRFGGNDRQRAGIFECGKGGQAFNKLNGDGSEGLTTNGHEIGLPDPEQVGELGRLGHRVHDVRNIWEKFPTQSPVCGGNDGVPDRVDRVKALGNSVVPQVVYEIFKAIKSTHIPCPT